MLEFNVCKRKYNYVLHSEFLNLACDVDDDEDSSFSLSLTPSRKIIKFSFFINAQHIHIYEKRNKNSLR